MLPIDRRFRLPHPHRLLTLLPLTCCLLFGALASTSLQAGEQGLVLKYYKPELSTTANAAQLYERIDRAARNRCEDPGRRSLTRRIEEQRCHRELLERAIRKIDSTVLSRIHADHRAATERSRG